MIILKKTLGDCETTLKAYSFAMKHHGELKQKRKYSGLPYMIHPISVAMKLVDWGCSSFEITAALLHDTVEDTKASNDDIRDNFGDEQANLNAELTKTNYPKCFKRQVKCNFENQRLAKASLKAKIIKIADIWDNVKDTIENENRISRQYLVEKWIQLHFLYDVELYFAFSEVRDLISNIAKCLHIQLPDITVQETTEKHKHYA